MELASALTGSRRCSVIHDVRAASEDWPRVDRQRSPAICKELFRGRRKRAHQAGRTATHMCSGMPWTSVRTLSAQSRWASLGGRRESESKEGDQNGAGSWERGNVGSDWSWIIRTGFADKQEQSLCNLIGESTRDEDFSRSASSLPGELHPRCSSSRSPTGTQIWRRYCGWIRANSGQQVGSKYSQSISMFINACPSVFMAPGIFNLPTAAIGLINVWGTPPRIPGAGMRIGASRVLPLTETADMPAPPAPEISDATATDSPDERQARRGESPEPRR